jgi:hypothetical protein
MQRTNPRQETPTKLTMENNDQQQPANQAGPSSAPPETQPGLQETIQSGEKILEGARNDDQLQRLSDAAKDTGNENKAPEPAGPGQTLMVTQWKRNSKI